MTFEAVALGQRYRLVEQHGNHPDDGDPAFHPDGIRTENADGTLTATVHPLPNGYPLPAGSVGTVVDVVPAEIEGAGNHDEDHVTLAFDVTVPGPHSRNVSFTEAELASLFELVSDAAEAPALVGEAGPEEVQA